jgi:hypothetical protein
VVEGLCAYEGGGVRRGDDCLCRGAWVGGCVVDV